jgi:hypothetical protein
MILALGPVLLVAASLLLGGLMSLALLGLLLLVSRPTRPPAGSSEHAIWRKESIIDPIQNGTAIAASER